MELHLTVGEVGVSRIADGSRIHNMVIWNCNYVHHVSFLHERNLSLGELLNWYSHNVRPFCKLCYAAGSPDHLHFYQ